MLHLLRFEIRFSEFLVFLMFFGFEGRVVNFNSYQMALDQIDVVSKDGGDVKVKEMTFFDHLEELRWHIMRSVLAVMVVAVAAFLMKDFLFNTIIFGPKQQDFISYRVLCSLSHSLGLGETLCIGPPPFDFITPNFGELFLTHIKVSFMAGLIAASPYILWEAWRFIKPGLYEKEVKVARHAVAICSSLFLAGVCFGYFVIAPFAVTFLAGYELPGVVAQPSLGSYISYLVMLTVPVGLTFELPVVVHVLTRIGLVSSALMKSYRRHAWVVIVVLASVITPPDVFSQILISVPLVLLYEVSIVVAKRVEKQEKEKEQQAA